MLGRDQAGPQNGVGSHPEARGVALSEPTADLVLVWESSFKTARATAGAHTHPCWYTPSNKQRSTACGTLGKH